MSSFKKDRQYLSHYWTYLSKMKGLLSLGFILIPLISFFHLMQPLLIKQGIDDNMLTGDTNGLYITAFIFASCVILEFVCKSLQGFIFQYLGQRTVTDIRKDLFIHVINLNNIF